MYVAAVQLRDRGLFQQTTTLYSHGQVVVTAYPKLPKSTGIGAVVAAFTVMLTSFSGVIVYCRGLALSLYAFFDLTGLMLNKERPRLLNEMVAVD